MTLAEVQALEHLTVVEVRNHPRYGEYYDVRTDKENGWYIHSTTWGEDEEITDPDEEPLPKTYKWATCLYAMDDISTVQIVHISEIPEDGLICSVGTDKQTE